MFRSTLFSDRARRGARGALYPKTSTCGAESLPEGATIRVSTEHAALKAGSCAAGLRESGQVRKEAALSDRSRVPQGCLAGAGDSGSAGWCHSTAECTVMKRLTFGEPFFVLRILYFVSPLHRFARRAPYTKPSGPIRQISWTCIGPPAKSSSGGGSLSNDR